MSVCMSICVYVISMYLGCVCVCLCIYVIVCMNACIYACGDEWRGRRIWSERNRGGVRVEAKGGLSGSRVLRYGGVWGLLLGSKCGRSG